MNFRFDQARHEYTDVTGAVLPHITGMLEADGLIDSTWMTAESCQRGLIVHSMTAAHDWGALNLLACANHPHRMYLLAYLAALAILRPEITAIEEAHVHPVYRFGGRPDREIILTGVHGVMEIKTGQEQRADAIQLALQAILVASKLKLPAESLGRYALHLRPSGKFRLKEKKDPRDFYEARRLIAKYCPCVH